MPQTPLGAYVAKLFGATSLQPLVVGKQNDLLASDLHGAKYTLAYNGSLFQGANPTGVTTSAGLATTYVGLCLSNPAASGKNLVVRSVSGLFIVAPATVTGLGLITGFVAGGVTAHTTALTPQSCIIGTTYAGVAKLDSACTLVGTPVWSQYNAETATATTLPSFNLDLAGAFVIPPGGYCAIGTTIAGPTSGFVGSFQWEEVAP